MFTLTRGGRWALGCAFVVTVLLLLWLPYQFPTPPSHSDSYIFGFNNRVGILILAGFALFCGAGALWMPARMPAAWAGKPLTSRTLYRALGLVFVVTLALYVLFRRFDGMGDGLLFIDRLKLVLEGHRVYLDFEFPYGPLMLYVPAALAKCLHLGAADAYGLTWIAAELGGVAMVYKSMQWIEAPFFPKRPVFLLLLLATLITAETCGLNYSILRFVLPCFLAVGIHRRLQRAEQRGSGFQAATVLLLAPAFALVLGISPEFALTFGLGMSVYLAVFARMRKVANIAALVVAAGLCVLAAWGDARLGAFLMAGAFHSGAQNLPIVPAPHILLFMMTLALTAAFSFRELRARRPSALLVLVIVSAASCGGALGRCDTVHVFYDPLGLTIAALGIAAAWPKAGMVFRSAVWLVFVVLALQVAKEFVTFAGPKAFVPVLLAHEAGRPPSRADAFILGHMTRALGAKTAALKFRSMQLAATQRGPLDIDRVFGEPEGTQFQVPFAFTVSHAGRYHDPHLHTGYFQGLDDVETPELVERKISELAQHPDRPLLIPDGDEMSCYLDAAGQRSFDSHLMMYPLRTPLRHQDDILNGFCDYIRANYHQTAAATPERYGYGVWKR